MPLQAPIKLTVYNQESEPVKTVMTGIVPWGVMKRAIHLLKQLPEGYEGMSEVQIMQSMSDEFIDALNCFVVDLFCGRVTIEELNTGVDLSEVLPLLSYAGMKSFTNPTPPGK